MSQKRPRSSEVNKSGTKRRSAIVDRRWRWILLVGLFLVGGIVPAAVLGVSVQLENNDLFCARCHTQPETDYVDSTLAVRSDQASSPDLATFHAAAHDASRCIDCHSGPGITGRLAALALGARDLMVFAQGNYPQPAVVTRSIDDANCSKCHANYAADRSFNNHYHGLLARWRSFARDRAATCVDCHARHARDGDKQLAYLNEDRAVGQCNACHRVMGD